MGLLHLLAFAGGIAAFLFVTLSLASGLLWLAELIEEHSKYAKTIGMRAIYVIIGLHIVLYFTDNLPITHVAFSIVCHLVYLSNFSPSWPFISLTSPRFILSCILVVGDHFVWFFHFAAVAQEAKHYRVPKYRYGGQQVKAAGNNPSFGDVAAFFAICVWFVPLYLFLSLSANDNALPSFDSSAPPSPSGSHVNLSSPNLQPVADRKHSTSLIKSALVPLLSLLPSIRSRSKRRNSEGLIAPRSPSKSSPLPSPALQSPNYYPWGTEEKPMSSPGFNPSHGSMTPLGRLKTPPPPRRTQSELQIRTRGNLHSGPQAEEGMRKVSVGRQEGLSSSTNLLPAIGNETELFKRKAD
uniref:Endoplasmic reticulum protein n=1 Tax=Cryptococcus bacillisporus CA1280 TaxID=1296109 RepID=A0A0D0UK32_CRYGA|nr:endoplasmic reticulum protein [Cryptococcus bacillisporus CA1280]